MNELAMIERVRELDKAATPGPWTGEDIGAGTVAYGVVAEHEGVIMHDFVSPANGKLIAEYRTLAPQLAERLAETRAEKLRDSFMPDTAANWREDKADDNGNYTNECVHCHRPFWGHKRRVVCRVCAQPHVAAMRARVAELEGQIALFRDWLFNESAASNETVAKFDEMLAPSRPDTETAE